MRARVKQNIPDSSKRLRLYGAITLILIALAIAVTLLPTGNPLQRCSGIILGESRDSCFYALATSTQNQSICASIQGSSQGPCYSQIAESTLSPQGCLNAASNSSARACVSYIAQATGNASLCTSLGAQYSDGCITSIAVSATNLSMCASEANFSNRQICASAISFNLASSTLLPAHCAQVSNSTDRSAISKILNLTKGAIASANSSVISSISSLAFLPSQNYSARDICYTLLASRTSNSALCANESASARGLCAYAVAGNYTNSTPTSYAQLIASCSAFQQYQGFCAQYVLLAEAIDTKNVSICASFSAALSLQCYSSMAAKYNNATFCGYIRNSTANNACLLQIK
ncbi:MAG: hypothetical protein KGH65_04785 [Candidatus Micrarchaeota archaeon]|nr:hypothetical protein [Candidatus Micrarchaeota archaeon]